MNEQVAIIRAEIERRMKELEDAPYAGPIQARVHEELNYFKKLIDSLPDEPKGWISVKDALPPMDEEVIVLNNQMHGKKLSTARRICFGHIVDRRYAMDYDGWNIPGVEYWMPCPPIPDEQPIGIHDIGVEGKNGVNASDPPECQDVFKVLSKPIQVIRKCEETEKSALKKCEEVDLEKELAKYEASLPESATVDPFEGHPTLKDIASYFYELGKQAKKEE